MRRTMILAGLAVTACGVLLDRTELAGPAPGVTVGTRRALGLRQSATEARIAAESAVAAGRLGATDLTDLTGLRRVLLGFSASP